LDVRCQAQVRRVVDAGARVPKVPPYIDASDIEVTVHNQEVTLSGTVATRLEKRLAEDVTAVVSGVLHVENHLRVRRATGTVTRY